MKPSDVERAEVVARTALARHWETLAHTARVVDLIGKRTGSVTRDQEIAAGWLHDVVEDTDVELVDLVDLGFDSDVVSAVRLLTRLSDYDAYKAALLAAPGESGRIARTVKLADARDNLARCERAAGVPKWERLAYQRYRPMIHALEAAGA